ncbi:ABC transporter substrate-binding protein [Leeia sp.]|uniref:ABC transporter substrate-binding protein n=1 Tax=Leeia sp. TaxID=2884678 RepID=UPI0035B336A1
MPRRLSAWLLLLTLCWPPTHAATRLDYWLHQFRPSTLTSTQQRAELSWFIQAARPYRGMTVRVLSEDITTHRYEQQVLAKAFSELTGIRVIHDIKPEGDLVRLLKNQLQGGPAVYDGFINDSDLIGTHMRMGQTVVLSDWMKGAGRELTLPTLALEDFIGLAFTMSPDGKLYQLPDQQFANLYWFRYDWFTRPDLQARFKARYGYALGVPLNWSAYEDIADFFTHQVKVIDGQRVYGHMDYGKRDPSLGWRFTDAWLSMAGEGSVGYPNGKPIDEWGIRVEGCNPAGASVSRGGGTNSPAAVYALQKYLDWIKQYAPPEARNLTFSEAGPIPGKGQIAQQIFWYTAFTADMAKPGLPINHPDGTPKWRMAPAPLGAYWEQGMQRGYQDVGAWTFLKNTPRPQLDMAWLYAQFTVSRTVSLKKSLTGLTFIRESDIHSPAASALAPKLGGLIEFYRSPSRVYWTPTGTNVPDYPQLAEFWWPRIAAALAAEQTPQQALDQLASQMDESLQKLSQQPGLRCPPRLNPPQLPTYWLGRPGGPKARLRNEKPRGETVPYDKLLRIWQEGGDTK